MPRREVREVLLVEPNEERTFELHAALEKAGYRVAEAASADQALWRFPTHVPAIVVCSFPSLLSSGESLISTLRRLPPEKGGEVPILALVRPRLQMMEAPRAARLGATEQCPSDVPPRTLAAMVRRAIGSPVG